MSACTSLSDRMPDVALGRSRWTEEEARHLASCADCRAEWTVIHAVGRLGASLPSAPDPGVTAARVRERLAAERARRRARTRALAGAGLAAAAALTLAVWPGRGRPAAPRVAPARVAGAVPAVPAPAPSSGGTAPVATGPGVHDGPELPLPELDSLPADALDSMLRVLDEPIARAYGDDAPLGDTGDQELEHALLGLEG
jgi:hypothetical protein